MSMVILILSLVAISGCKEAGGGTTTAILVWTAVGDDALVGTASQYDIRYSATPLTELNWDAATQCIGEPLPKIAGAAETFVVTGLTPSTTYWFGMKVADEVPNWSDLSNVVSITTIDGVRPAPISTLTVTQ
jgi:phosphodiesterase/alkaline phosphatase D-like protein